MQLLYTRLAHRLKGLTRPFVRMHVVQTPGQPISRVFGRDRGLSIDRWWIDRYFERHASERSGQGLEVGGTEYLRAWFPKMQARHLEFAHDGTPDCVVCDLTVGNPAHAASFDLLIATQVFNFIYEPRVAIGHAAALLKPGGVLLGSVGGISQISRYDADRWGHYQSFTPQCIERMLREHFADVSVESFGNVDTACAFLHGLAAEEVDRELLTQHDRDYPVFVCFRAVRG